MENCTRIDVPLPVEVGSGEKLDQRTKHLRNNALFVLQHKHGVFVMVLEFPM